MEFDLVNEIWNELKQFIIATDRSDAAHSLVSLLVENGFSGETIKEHLGDDRDIRSALSLYLEDDDDDDEYEENNEQDDW